jgi:hypothetical protein
MSRQTLDLIKFKILTARNSKNNNEENANIKWLN